MKFLILLAISCCIKRMKSERKAKIVSSKLFEFSIRWNTLFNLIIHSKTPQSENMEINVPISVVVNRFERKTFKKAKIKSNNITP